MKRLLFFLGLSFIFLLAPGAIAKLGVKCNVEKIAQHELLVTLSWKVNVNSDKNWDACDLVISFRDREGIEIHQIKETLQLKIGDNSISGIEICDAEIWQSTEKFTATLDCII